MRQKESLTESEAKEIPKWIIEIKEIYYPKSSNYLKRKIVLDIDQN